MLKVGTKVKLNKRVCVDKLNNVFIEENEERTIVQVHKVDKRLPYQLDGEVGIKEYPSSMGCGWVSADDISPS